MTQDTEHKARLEAGKAFYEQTLAGTYECDVCGGSGLYLNETADDVESCDKCETLFDYMKAKKLGWYANDEPLPDYGDGIPF